MEPNLTVQTASVDPTVRLDVSPSVCPVCHQPLFPQYYFCPNCGAKTKEAILSTAVSTQVWIYVFSIILPMICFIFVTKWPGIKYYKSGDEKVHRIGQIAWILLVLSTILTIWLAYMWTEQMIQSSINNINTDFSGL